MPAPVRRCLKRYGFSLTPVEESLGGIGVYQSFWRGTTVKICFLTSFGTVGMWVVNEYVKNIGKIEDCCSGIREFMEKIGKPA